MGSAQLFLLPPAPEWNDTTRSAFVDVAAGLSSHTRSGVNPDQLDLGESSRDAGFSAAVHVISDLAGQGWHVLVGDGEDVLVSPPSAEADPIAEKDRVRRQELLKRDEQLSSPSVRRFVEEMERPREFQDGFVSIFSLMRDGSELAAQLREIASQGYERPDTWRKAIDPYVQVVNNSDRCEQTGLRLVDVWRYFRHTWSNQYASTPGRTMLLLVRDRAAPFHPVIGIAALGSAVIQIRERDKWIGWQQDDFIADLQHKPTLRVARWVVRRLEQALDEIYLDDLLSDGLFWPTTWASPTSDAIAALEDEATSCRQRHHRFVKRSALKSSKAEIDWPARAESDLFRSKRCLALAGLLRARRALQPFMYPMPSVRGLRDALSDAEARKAISSVIRRAKAEAVGTEIADLTVCGAVAPYNALLGGKLVGMLAVSPTVVRAYSERYRGYAGEIASAIAGRPIMRRSNLVFIGTTSLYGSGSSQYNRLQIPKNVLGSRDELRFAELGRSKSYGTSHLSAGSVAALLKVSEQSRNGVRVNSIFGEGVNPKLRKVRDGLDQLGWPSNDLLQHRRQRIVFGVALVCNLRDYLLGIDEQPRYTFRPSIRNDVGRIGDWWTERWLANRVQSADVMAQVASNTTRRPVVHGARVVLPPAVVRDGED